MSKLARYNNDELVGLAIETKFSKNAVLDRLEISERTLNREIHTRFGCPTVEWFDQHRMAVAPKILKEKHSVKLAAEELGYKPRTFSDKFASLYGIRPRQFLTQQLRTL